MDENKYTITYDHLPDEQESEYNYEAVPTEDDVQIPEGEEDLLATVRVLQEAADDDAAMTERVANARPVLITCPPSVDDFVRSFLLKIGMQKTLDTFQAEFYELQQKGLLKEEDLSEVPDIYARNQQLDDQLKVMRHERDKYKAASMAAREMYVKLRNERDFHRMNHRRVVQEKNRLIDELKLVRQHYAGYEPALAQLRKKYEVAMKERMLSKLERDRAMGQVAGLQSTLKSLEQMRGSSAGRPGVSGRNGEQMRRDGGGEGGGEGVGWPVNGQRRLEQPGRRELTNKEAMEARRRADARMDVGNWPAGYTRHPNDKDFPRDTGVNPALANGRGAPVHLTRSGGLKLAGTWQDAHDAAVSCLVVDPTGKAELVTGGDDSKWKLWNSSDGKCEFTGEGHSQWVSCLDYHPTGQQLASGSGDSTVRLWDFHARECIHSFNEHNGAVWSLQYHWTGDFVASAGMDATVRIFDLGSVRCRQILRGHADSVNSVTWIPHGNLLLSSSADKVLLLWDPRVGASVATFHGHAHSVNHATVNPKGDAVASVDSFGFLKVFDVRSGRPKLSLDLGPHPANHAAFDPSSSVLAVASNDGAVKMVEVATGAVTKLEAHEDSVQCCAFDLHADCLFSAGSDRTVRTWN